MENRDAEVAPTLSEIPDLGPAVSPMALGEAQPVCALPFSERTRRLFWQDRH